ncbi:Phi-29-like late activator [Enterococcus lactis]|uniref:Phi-29-like late activator n=1 Tax=Enterococcus TaxID=1350 RepID=UPI00398EB20B
MVEHKFIERITWESFRTKETLEKVITRLLNTMNKVKALDESQELTLLYLKKIIEKRTSEIDACNNEIKRINSLTFLGKQEDNWRDTIVWSDYMKLRKKFYLIVEDFKNFVEQYKYYTPPNSEGLKQKVITILNKMGYIVDGYFEGDYVTWIGVYARPEDKPTYLDPTNEKEAYLQNKHRVDGFKQDFAEWFEWDIKENEIIV